MDAQGLGICLRVGSAGGSRWGETLPVGSGRRLPGLRWTFRAHGKQTISQCHDCKISINNHLHRFCAMWHGRHVSQRRCHERTANGTILGGMSRRSDKPIANPFGSLARVVAPDIHRPIDARTRKCTLDSNALSPIPPVEGSDFDAALIEPRLRGYGLASGITQVEDLASLGKASMGRGSTFDLHLPLRLDGHEETAE